MSHYTVAVITRTDDYEELERLLAPFDENMEVEPYVSRTREQIIKDAKANKERWVESIEKEGTTKEDLVEFLTSPEFDWLRNLLAAKTDEDFYEAEAYPEQVGADGNEYSTYNPDSKWDWWTIGGRWSGSLRDYEGNYHDTLRIADWDYNYMSPEAVKTYGRMWDIAVEGAEPTEDEKDGLWRLYKPEYYLEKYGNKSEYIKSMLTFSTYAVLTADGEWLAPGKMGWFGISMADTKTEGEWERNFTRLIDTADKDMYITIVDCHI